MDWAIFWAAMAVVAAILLHINERIKDRRQRHVESMLKFAGDFYSDEAMSQLFLKIQNGTLSRNSIEKTGSAEELALAHLLEYLNAVGIALERKLVALKAIAATSIAYIVLTMSKNDAVVHYLAIIEKQHVKGGIPSPGWPQFEYLAECLALYARKHPGIPDLRPLYAQFIDPSKNRHRRLVQKYLLCHRRKLH